MGKLKRKASPFKKLRRMLRGIQGRWMLNSLGLVFMIVLVAVMAYSIAAANFYTAGARAGLESRATAAGNFFSRYLNTSYNDFFQGAHRFAEEFEDRDKLELQFINQVGRIEVSTMGITVGLVPGTPDVRGAVESGEVNSFLGVDPLSGERVMSVSAPLIFANRQVMGVMRYVTSMSEVDKRILMASGMAMLLGIAVIAFVAGSNLFFIRSILLPIQEINEIAKKIADGGYGVMIEKKYDDEIGELADTINNMSAEISLADRIKNDFISSVSHELRTPLTAIAGWGETLLSVESNDIAEVKKGVRIMLGESHRLTKMVEELLEFTRMASGRMTLRMEEFDIREELQEVVYLYIETLARDNILLTYQEDEEIPLITGDRARLRQVFINLLDNAAKHGGEGRRIDMMTRTADDRLIVTIRDYGAGIPEEELPHVKYKFYKGSSKARGSGIGLAVSDEIIRLHDGTLDIESQVGEGTTVTVSLPIHIGQPSEE
ncbi:MAG: HAMP domain-containing histidine kinase [Oscillospiraceae bacterium]|jgi:signal transduction histidine kinase|nr:HAMP domain-containing histidine kinase [Oscillospiraceae bacterium]